MLGRYLIAQDEGVPLKGVKDSDKCQEECSPIESQGSEQASLHSKLSLRGESTCGWIHC